MSQTEILSATSAIVESTESTDSSVSSVSSVSKNVMNRIAVTKLNICGAYTLKKGLATADACQICKQQLTAPSLENMQKGETNVQIAIGKCDHCFHETCIKSYTSKGNLSCPIDNTPWMLDSIYCLKNVLSNNNESSNEVQKFVSEEKEKKQNIFEQKVKILSNFL